MKLSPGLFVTCSVVALLYGGSSNRSTGNAFQPSISGGHRIRQPETQQTSVHGRWQQGTPSGSTFHSRIIGDDQFRRIGARHSRTLRRAKRGNSDGDEKSSQRLVGSASSAHRPRRRHRRQLNKDVVIVGGGLAGLSAALYLSQIDPDRHITILDKEDIEQNHKKSSVSSFAAAGMLAPQSERLPKGDYLDLCLASKRMFPEFADLVESLAEDSGDEGKPFLQHYDGEDDSGLEPWNIGYVAAGGFLAPAFAGDNVATWAPPEDSRGTARWLDGIQVRELEPNLHPDVVGGWWFPEDASVDARRLTCSLRAACAGAGVQYLCGPNYEVSSLDLEEGVCQGIWLKSGRYISTKTVLVANGAWMRTLLPVPVEPHKGQSISLRMPKDRPPLLRRVLFAQDSYIVPKADGRIVIGATVEAGSFDPHVTPAGILHILSYALQVLPALADLPLEETWAGLRPTTPDKGPILGETPWENLYLAGGYWRNGVLLAPKTGELLASLIAGHELDETDQAFLKAFSWDRFTYPGGGTALAANARFAASMYPVHSRKSGVGIAASVGTELGSYSTARSATDERRKDREMLWGGGDEEAFERAALLGKKDAAAFSFGIQQNDGNDDDDDDDDTDNDGSDGGNNDTDNLLDSASDISLSSEPFPDMKSQTESKTDTETVPYSGSPDAFTVGYTSEGATTDESSGTETDDLKAVYDKISRNKANESFDTVGNTGDDEDDEERPDPGFRIWHVEKGTGTVREVPPYTGPGEFLASIEKEKQQAALENEEVEEASSKEKGDAQLTSTPNGAQKQQQQQKGPDETTYDGYQEIFQAAAEVDDVKEMMRQARMKNRMPSGKDSILFGIGAVDESFGKFVQGMTVTPDKNDKDDEDDDGSLGDTSLTMSKDSTETNLQDAYDTILQNKAKESFDMGTGDDTGDDEDGEERPDPGFRIWHVEKGTGTVREVPPYTGPGEFLASIEKEKQQAALKNEEVEEASSKEKGDAQLTSTPNGAQEQQQQQKGPDETTYDGYQEIFQAAAEVDDVKEMMRQARMKNRIPSGKDSILFGIGSSDNDIDDGKNNDGKNTTGS